MVDQTVQSDDAYLKQFGVEPRLRRALGFLSSSLFAIAFQGPTTGALLITGACVALGGPAFVWAVPLIFVFQFIIALNWAELASHYPLTGGIYQWAKYLGGEMLGWATGLFYIVALAITMAAVGLVMNIVLSGLFPSQIQFNTTTEIVVSFITTIVAAIIISTSVRVVALINNIGVTLELIVLGGAAILLLTHTHQPLSALTNTGGTEGSGSYVLGPFLIVIALVIAQILGFETAGAFAEETRNSRIKPSQAIMAAVAGVALFLFVFDCSIVLAQPDLAKAMKEPETLIPATLAANFGDNGAKLFLAGAFISVSSTAIATMAAAVRTLYGMARDNQLPFSRQLTTLNKMSDEPVIAVAVIAILSMVPLLFVQQIPVIVAAVTGLILLPYVIVLAALLRRRLQGWPKADAPFKLGTWGVPLTVVGLVWAAGVTVDALWPREATNPNLGPFPVIEELCAIVILFGAVWWFAVLRGRLANAKIIDPEAVGQAATTR